jgi:transposase
VHTDFVSEAFYAELAMRCNILGPERRRWGDDEKLEIVQSVSVSGAMVTQVAQRHGVTRRQIYAWRHVLKKKVADTDQEPDEMV